MTEDETGSLENMAVLQVCYTFLNRIPETVDSCLDYVDLPKLWLGEFRRGHGVASGTGLTQPDSGYGIGKGIRDGIGWQDCVGMGYALGWGLSNPSGTWTDPRSHGR